MLITFLRRKPQEQNQGSWPSGCATCLRKGQGWGSWRPPRPREPRGTEDGSAEEDRALGGASVMLPRHLPASPKAKRYYQWSLGIHVSSTRTITSLSSGPEAEFLSDLESRMGTDGLCIWWQAILWWWLWEGGLCKTGGTRGDLSQYQSLDLEVSGGQHRL